MSKTASCLGVAILALLVGPFTGPLAAQDHGGGAGCGDVFGDLIHIVRDDITGQPILARRFIELPKEIPGYGWGYCPIAITAAGEEIPFLPFSCDLNLDPDGDGIPELDPLEVDYFGRLSGGRTKEKNHRMHLNEVISSIKMAGAVKAEPATGRLMMGYDCEPNYGGHLLCQDWSVVDSPMESLALYVRLMKYGHLQTDPQELDLWVHGDPKLVPSFHPALDPADWAKFHSSLWHLLPAGGNPSACFTDDFPAGGNGIYDAPEPFEDANGSGFYEPGEPFDDVNENGIRDPGDTFDAACAAPESLVNRDFVRGASFLGAAANKTGIVTADLVQYMNRILKIALVTTTTAANPDTLPALVRDCEDPDVTYEPPDETDPNPQDPPYRDLCPIYEAHPGLDNYESFPDVQERFVDFSALDGNPYRRSEWREETYEVLILSDPGEGPEPTAWYLTQNVGVLDWLHYANGPEVTAGSLRGFVDAASDGVRTVEFIHNYAVPAYLPFELQ